ncbi:MAG TPA: aminoacyl-tRNA hydrolase [Proteobacteria bacterium]|nr:aminoacyl-tRNA hydrolase [Pseudomonadota bacterium]
MIFITPTIAIDESEIREEFIRASGPGGQNVNKVSTAVQLRFDVGNSPSLSDEIRARLIRLAGRRITSDGILIIEAKRLRTQSGNRRDAMDRLVDLVRRAAHPPRSRRKTYPTRASKERRLEAKRRRSRAKNLRRSVSVEDEA